MTKLNRHEAQAHLESTILKIVKSVLAEGNQEILTPRSPLLSCEATIEFDDEKSFVRAVCTTAKKTAITIALPLQLYCKHIGPLKLTSDASGKVSAPLDTVRLLAYMNQLYTREDFIAPI